MISIHLLTQQDQIIISFKDGFQIIANSLILIENVECMGLWEMLTSLSFFKNLLRICRLLIMLEIIHFHFYKDGMLIGLQIIMIRSHRLKI